MAQVQHVLVAVDDSAASSRVLDSAIDLAARLPADLVIATVAVPYDMLGETPRAEVAKAALSAATATARGAAERAEERGVPTRVITDEGPVAECIAAAAETVDAQYVVVGSGSQRPMHRLLHGSVYNSLVHCTHRTVVVVHDRP